MSAARIRIWPFVCLTIFVCAAGIVVGGFFGRLAVSLAESRWTINLGIGLGGFGGLVAGIVWCTAMIRRAIRKGTADLVARGSILGLGVGLLATCILHGGLFLTAMALVIRSGREPRLPESEYFLVIVVALICGAVAGLLTGFICGVLCWVAAGLADVRPTGTPAKAAVPPREHDRDPPADLETQVGPDGKDQPARPADRQDD